MHSPSNHLSTLPTFLITIKGNVASEYYADIITPLWEDLLISPQRFDAVTPETLHQHGLLFGPREDNRVEATQTERASTCSHYLLWKKCVEMNQRIFVLEHDAFPVPELGNIFYDRPELDYYGFAPGTAAYVMGPQYAKYLCDTFIKTPIRGGTLGLIHHFSKPPWNIVHDFTKPEFEIKAKQLISRKYGSTSTHSSMYETTLTFKESGEIDRNHLPEDQLSRVFEIID